MNTKHVYQINEEGELYWYVASSPEESLQMHEDLMNYDMDYPGDTHRGDPYKIPDDQLIQGETEVMGRSVILTKTAKEWADSFGFLSSTNM